MDIMDIDEFLDGEIAENSKLLPDLLRGLKKKETLLQGQLSGIEADQEANEWQRVVSDVRKTVSELAELKSRCSVLVEETTSPTAGEKESGKAGETALDGGEGEGGAWLSEGGRRCVQGVEPLVKELVQLERLQSYFTWMRRLHQFGSQLESQISNSATLETAVSTYFELCDVCSSLEKSFCANLKQFALSLKSHWSDRLRETLSNDFSSVLKEIKWPVVSSAVSSKQTEIWKKLEKKFTKLFSLLLKLDVDDSKASLKPPLEAGFRKTSLGDPIVLPLELLLAPLRKRFRYHFSGNRKTNSKEKPEWYFTQVSGWIGDHTYFLENTVQPLLMELDCAHIDARTEFIRGLLQEIEVKLLHDLPEIVHDDDLMAHSIDELLLFDKELRLKFQYSHPSPSILHVLLDEVRFHKWLTLEKTYAVERLHSIVKSETAWDPAYSSVDGADDTRVPECTEGFMVLIKGIEERYKPLLSTRHQLRFLDLQRDLLLEFHQDLANNWGAVSGNPLVPQAAAYINAANYIATVLRQWGETEFFLELQHYVLTTSIEGENAATLAGSDETPPDLSASSNSRSRIKSIHILRQQDEEYASLLGTVFDSVIEAFTSLVRDMERSLVQFIVSSVKSKCYSFKQEKWHSIKPNKDELSLDITSASADLLTSLRYHLSFLDLYLSPSLTLNTFETLATRIDKLLVTEVVLGSAGFSDGGAQQLQYDITKCLVPLLDKYCDTIPKKQLLERTREACILLQLSSGSARLTQELLQQAVAARPKGDAPVISDTYEAAVTALNEMSVHTLDPNEAERILRLRIFPPQ